MVKEYGRGSEWRKWDLHVHTPFTKLNNNYRKEENVWDLFCEKLEKSDISVFGITDYFSIENYITFISKFNSKYPSSKKVFFPNIEFRIDSKNKDTDHIQVHILFSKKKETTEKIKGFLDRLPLVSTDDEALTAKYCTMNDLTEVGFKKAMVLIDTLKKQLESDFKKNEYLIAGLATGYGSLRPGKNDGRGDEYAKELDKKINFFFGKSTNTDFYLNKHNCRAKYNLPPKPVVFASDSHSFSDLDSKIGKEFTWIKADPTFEGLRQIVYEPEDRVKIQESKPDDKEDYHVIDSVNFVVSDNTFPSEKILINQNLTVIIGGKSTGKSLLLRNIARKIDSNEVENRLKEVDLKEYKNKDVGFNVFWKDGENNPERKIIYIPQAYLNRLSDKEEEHTSIDEIINNILIQEEDIRSVFDSLKNRQREIERNITQGIESLFHKKQDIDFLEGEVKKIGDKSGIENEIKKLEEEIKTLKEKAGMTDDEIELYNSQSSNLKKCRNDLISLEKDKNILNFLISNPYFFPVEEDRYEISSEYQEKINSTIGKIKKLSIEIWEKDLKAFNNEVSLKIESEKKRLSELETQIKPLLDKAKKSEALNEKMKSLSEQEKKMEKITKEQDKLKNLKHEHEKIISSIFENYRVFYSELVVTKDKVLDQKSITGDQELEFEISINFQKTSFQTEISNIFDGRKLSQFESVNLSEYSYISEELFSDDVKIVMKAILNDELRRKGGFSKKESLTKLLKNWFIIDYNIKHNGDELSDMSPGKKSFVLLKLLIDLDSSKCPILLDQPEDDLDNRSIYSDLVRFIKEKKKQRQIIIVTHNPNLVVGADAECVIVSNQDGEKSRNKKFTFEYVEGSLENSFKSISSEIGVLYNQGIQEHVCDILEGGKMAFEQRKKKYNF